MTIKPMKRLRIESREIKKNAIQLLKANKVIIEINVRLNKELQEAKARIEELML